MTYEKASIVFAPFIVALLTTHVSQDVIYGMEEGDASDLIAVAITGVWLYGALAFAGKRFGCVLLLIASFLIPVVPLAHMSGAGISKDVAKIGGDVFFVWTLVAIGVTAPVSFLFAIQGLWRLRQSVLGFLLSAAIPVAAGGALLGYVVNELYLTAPK